MLKVSMGAINTSLKLNYLKTQTRGAKTIETHSACYG